MTVQLFIKHHKHIVRNNNHIINLQKLYIPFMSLYKHQVVHNIQKKMFNNNCDPICSLLLLCLYIHAVKFTFYERKTSFDNKRKKIFFFFIKNYSKIKKFK